MLKRQMSAQGQGQGKGKGAQPRLELAAFVMPPSASSGGGDDSACGADESDLESFLDSPRSSILNTQSSDYMQPSPKFQELFAGGSFTL